MGSDIPKYDLQDDYIVGKGFEKDLLNQYMNFPCRIESGFFILCMKGTMRVTINTDTKDNDRNDFQIKKS